MLRPLLCVLVQLSAARAAPARRRPTARVVTLTQPVPPAPPDPVGINDCPWAVVTGASSGIGAALARELCANDFNVLLTARRQDRLEELAAELERDHAGMRTLVVPADLGRRGGADAVHRATRGLPVTFIAVNAGFALQGDAVSQSSDALAEMLEVNVLSVARLTQLCAADLAERGEGGCILVTGSITAACALPGAAAYGASKAFVRSWCAALRAELAPAGVGVTCLQPGATASEFASSAHTDGALAFSMRGARASGLLMSPEAVARRAVAASLAGRGECVPGLLNAAFVKLGPLLPARGGERIASLFFCAPEYRRKRRAAARAAARGSRGSPRRGAARFDFGLDLHPEAARTLFASPFRGRAPE